MFSKAVPVESAADAKTKTMEPQKILFAVEKLSNMLEENDFKYRENNAILADHFDSELKKLEERLSSQLDAVKLNVSSKIRVVEEFELGNALYKKKNVPTLHKLFGEASVNYNPPPDHGSGSASTATSNESGTPPGEPSGIEGAGAAAAAGGTPQRRGSGTRGVGMLPGEEDTEVRRSLGREGNFEFVSVRPRPGFVIKTHRTAGGMEKVFVNVFQHPAVSMTPPAIDPPHSREENINPYVIIGGVTSTLDKESHLCIMYNIAVNSIYFNVSKPRKELAKIADKETVAKMLTWINKEYSDCLNTDAFTLPRLANFFKGNFIPPITVTVDHTPPPIRPAASLSGSGHAAAGGAGRNKSLDTISELGDDDIGDGKSATSRNGSHYGSFFGGRPRSDSFGSETSHGSSGTTRSVNLRVKHRKSVFGDGVAYNESNIAGRKRLRPHMMEYIKEETVDGRIAIKVKEESKKNPLVLLGWQIKATDDEGETILFVVTDVRKNFLHKTEFRLSRLDADDWWIKLMRDEQRHKGDLEFLPMRKVLFDLEKEQIHA